MALERNHRKYFLPYQERWLQDKSLLKICEKSRRIGMTYAESYEDVRHGARTKANGGSNVYFSSADITAASEYIDYCAWWAKVLDIAAEYLGEELLEKDGDVGALVLRLSSGHKIHALSSRPENFRSKGGKLVLDEYGFHKDQDKLWSAAGPIVLWGYPVSVLSTYNGDSNRYARMVSDAKKGNSWSLHTITLEDAIADGLVDKILKRPATAQDIQDFRDRCWDIAGDQETFNEEFMCIPRSSNSAWLDWDVITACEHPDAGQPKLYQGGPVYVGKDYAKRRDMAPIWVSELVGDVLWTREIVELHHKTFKEQREELARVFSQYRVVRACLDQTGMGEAPVEQAQEDHGALRVEGILFNNSSKTELAVGIKQLFQDKRVRIPSGRTIREHHHAIREMTTSTGASRFDAERNETGHADLFWAHALAAYAFNGTPVIPFEYQSAGKRRGGFGKGAW